MDQKGFIVDENLDIPAQSYKDLERDWRIIVNGVQHNENKAQERIYNTMLELANLFNKKLKDSSLIVMKSGGYLYAKRLLGFIHQGIVFDATDYLTQKYASHYKGQVFVNQTPDVGHVFNVTIDDKDNVIVTYETVLTINQHDIDEIGPVGYVKVKRTIIIPLKDMEQVLDNKDLENRSLEEIFPNLTVEEKYSKKFDTVDELKKSS